MPTTQHANLIVLGHTGAGKSSFINYLIGQDLLKTGKGQPITQNFDAYMEDKAFGLPTCIYDSKGLEVAEYQEMSDNIIRFIQEKCEKEDIYYWIHTIFYCINRTKARLDDSERNLIQRIQKETMRTVHVVLTNCDGSSEDDAMKKYVREALGRDTHIYCVSSVAEKTRRGITEQFGKKEIMEGIFKVLWEDILHVMAKRTANQFSHHFEKAMKAFSDLLKAKMPTQTTEFDAGVFASNCVSLLESQIDDIKKYNKAIAVISKQNISSFVHFFNQYGMAGNFHVDETAIDDISIELSDLLDKTACKIEREYFQQEQNAYASFISSTGIAQNAAEALAALLVPGGWIAYKIYKYVTQDSKREKYRKEYFDACDKMTNRIKEEFPTQERLELILWNNLHKTTLLKKMNISESKLQKWDISTNGLRQRDDSIVFVVDPRGQATITSYEDWMFRRKRKRGN